MSRERYETIPTGLIVATAGAVVLGAVLGANRYPYVDRRNSETIVQVTPERELIDYNSDGLVDFVNQQVPRTTSFTKLKPSAEDQRIYSEAVKKHNQDLQALIW